MPASRPASRSRPDSKSCHATLLAVDVVHHAPGWARVLEDDVLVRAANAAFGAAAGTAPPAELSLLLTGDDEIRALNKRWRGRDIATNVLSFPLDAPFGGAGPRPLGDVALAFETVAREAAARSIPVGHHAAHLVVHGVLHLLGYTHEDDSHAQEMEALEARVLTGLGVPDPYGQEAMNAGEGQ